MPLSLSCVKPIQTQKICSFPVKTHAHSPVLPCSTQGGRSPFMKPLIILALETGMRRGELLKLKHEDWDIRSSLISINETKNGKCRVIPASNRANQTLCKLAQNNTHSLIPLSGNAVNLSFQRLKRRTGLNCSWTVLCKG